MYCALRNNAKTTQRQDKANRHLSEGSQSLRITKNTDSLDVMLWCDTVVTVTTLLLLQWPINNNGWNQRTTETVDRLLYRDVSVQSTCLLGGLVVCGRPSSKWSCVVPAGQAGVYANPTARHQFDHQNTWIMVRFHRAVNVISFFLDFYKPSTNFVPYFYFQQEKFLAFYQLGKVISVAIDDTVWSCASQWNTFE